MKRIDKGNWSGQSPMLVRPTMQYELAEQNQAIACGGIDVAQQLVRQLKGEDCSSEVVKFWH